MRGKEAFYWQTEDEEDWGDKVKTCFSLSWNRLTRCDFSREMLSLINVMGFKGITKWEMYAFMYTNATKVTSSFSFSPYVTLYLKACSFSLLRSCGFSLFFILQSLFEPPPLATLKHKAFFEHLNSFEQSLLSSYNLVLIKKRFKILFLCSLKTPKWWLHIWPDLHMYSTQTARSTFQHRLYTVE